MMQIPTYEESNQAVMVGYADAIHAFINEHEPADGELFRSDLQVLVDDLIQTEAKKCAEHYAKIMRDVVMQAVLKEREECAKLCDGLSGRSYEYDMGRLHSAATIRQQGNE